MDNDRDNVKRSAILQLLWHISITRRIWFPPSTTNGLVSSAFPRVQLLDIPTPFSDVAAYLEGAAAWTYIFSLLVQLVISGRKSTTSHAVVTAVAIVSYFVVALQNVAHVQPPVLHGLVLLLASSCCSWTDGVGMTVARVVVSGTWLWSGIHKVNPSFLSKESNLIDPVFFLVLGSDLAKKHRVLLHLVIALTEAAAGLTLLLASLNLWLSRRYGRLFSALVRVSVLFLVSMHAIIIVRLVRTAWNYSVIGWNLSCLYLAFLLWRERDQRYPTTIAKSNVCTGSGAVVVLAALVAFALLPALVVVGRLDPYLGSSLYSSNVPDLEIELPFGGSPSPTTDLFRQWGLLDDAYGKSFIPALTHDGRQIVRTDYVAMQVKATDGGVGYPSKWSLSLFASALCKEMHYAAAAADGNNVTDLTGDARFYLQLPYTGATLLESLWAMADKSKPPPLLPPKLLMEGCEAADVCGDDDSVWQRVLQPIAIEGPIEAYFSIAESLPPMDIYWVGNVEEHLEADGSVNKRPKLVHQGRAGGAEHRVRTQTYVGHMFVAVDQRESGAGAEELCAQEVWVVTSDSNVQNFVLDSVRGNIDRRTVPGLKPCPLTGNGT